MDVQPQASVGASSVALAPLGPLQSGVDHRGRTPLVEHGPELRCGTGSVGSATNNAGSAPDTSDEGSRPVLETSPSSAASGAANRTTSCAPVPVARSARAGDFALRAPAEC